MDRREKYIGLMCAAAIGLAGPALSLPLTVVNPGFEDITGETPQFEFTFGPLNGWDLYNPQFNSGVFIGTLTPVEADPVGDPGVYINFTDGAAEGDRLGIAFLSRADYLAGNQGEFGVVQTLGDALAPNTRYTLSVEIGNIASGQSQGFGFFNLAGFPGYRVDLLAGGVPIASDFNTLAGSIPDGAWATSSFNFTTGTSLIVEGQQRIGQALGIRLVNLNVPDLTNTDTTNADLEVDFDQVALLATPALPGDTDGDGDIDDADLGTSFANYTGPVGAAGGKTFADGDTDGDGDIDDSDLGTTFSGYTGPLSPTSVPEPGALALIALGGLIMLRRRRSI